MAATFPGGVKVFTTKQAGDQIASAHINDLQDEVVAVETELRKTSGSVVSHGSLAGLNNNDHPQYLLSNAWQSYTVGWTAATTNPSIGNGTLIGRYVQIGKTIICSIALTIGSTTTYGSGNWIFSLPVMSKNATVWYCGSFIARVSGVYPGTLSVGPNASGIDWFAGGNFVFLNANSPAAWQSDNTLWASVTYEAA